MNSSTIVQGAQKRGNTCQIWQKKKSWFKYNKIINFPSTWKVDTRVLNYLITCENLVAFYQCWLRLWALQKLSEDTLSFLPIRSKHYFKISKPYVYISSCLVYKQSTHSFDRFVVLQYYVWTRMDWRASGLSPEQIMHESQTYDIKITSSCTLVVDMILHYNICLYKSLKISPVVLETEVLVFFIEFHWRVASRVIHWNYIPLWLE